MIARCEMWGMAREIGIIMDASLDEPVGNPDDDKKDDDMTMAYVV